MSNTRCRYEKLPAPPVPKGSVYSFAGYSTSYRFLTYQSIDPNHEVGEISSDNPIPTSSQPCRGRISQFLILPPHQKQGHGSQLYNTMVEAFLKDPACIEITVEDPNESFDDMRDYQDFERLTKNGTFAQIKINPDIDPKLTRRVGSHVPTAKLFDQVNLSKLKANNKIAPRQWNRLVELYLLSKIPKHTREASTSRLTQKAKSADIDDRTFYYWRLLVKQRIYKQHRDVLVTLDSGDRVEKLEATVTSQTDEYLRLLRRIEDEPRPSDSDAPPAATQRAGKRKIIEDDDDDDDDDDDGATGSDPKRLKEAEVEA
jgi:histone acetyltransferase 1